MDFGLAGGNYEARPFLMRNKDLAMRGSRLELLFATTAVALVVTGSSGPSQAAPRTPAEIAAAVPMPEPANLPPPTAADAAPIAFGAPSAAPPAQAAAPVPAPSPQPMIAAPAAAPVPAVSAALPVPNIPAATPAAAPAATGTIVPAAPAAAPPAEAPIPAVLQPVAEKIRDLFASKIDRFIDRKNKPALEAFYAARSYAPIWVENGAESARAKAATAYLAGVDANGLDPSDYAVPSFANADPAALAEAEIKFTVSVLTYARHAQIGRVHYSRVSADIVYDLVAPDPAAVLAKLADATNVGEALDSYNPQHPGYRALKAKLAEAHGRSGDAGRVRIAAGQTLKAGMEDPRVPFLRERLGVNEGDGNLFDKVLSEAVKKFQRGRDLPQTGTLNNATVDALNGQRRDRDTDIIIANMERWRWLPRDLGQAYVMVNIPDYTLRVMDRGEMVWTTKVVTGQPGEKATPLLSETMKFITVNPTWNVPPSIINNEYLPALAQDPLALDRIGLKLERNRDGTVRIYQPPGEANALGRIRFNFPNKFLVYQHDTPDKHLFAKDRRAYSHGCMRVQFPDRYAEVLLNISNPRDGYTADRIRKMYGTGERDIHLTTPIPVHLTYQTAFVDDAGHLAIREDIYGRDARLLALLKGEERRIADMPVERRDPNGGTRRQVARMPPPAQPTSFFGFLFR
jgi:L,D-transpeptidase YcbB